MNKNYFFSTLGKVKRMVSALALTFLFAISGQKVEAQYCAASHSGLNCATTDLITNVTISGTTLNNSQSACNGVNRQKSFSASGNTTATLYRTANYNQYSLSVTSSASSIISVWIDFDQSGTFDASEWWQVTTSSTANSASSVQITVPTSATLGQTGMRVRSRAVGNQNGSGDACLTFGSGMTHDYTVTIDTLAPCSGTPTAGSVFAASDSICPGVNFSLSTSGGTYGSGQTYQWQYSTNGSNWTNVASGNTRSLSTSQNINTYYRFYTECSGNADTSASYLIYVKPFYMCYCSSGATSTVDDDIGNVTFGNFTNGSDTLPVTNNATSTNTYSDFTNLTPDTFDANNSYLMRVTQINSAGFYTCFATAYIDFDQDGQFSATERIFAKGTQNPTNVAFGNIVEDSVFIPTAAMDGVTRMRVVLREGGSAATNNPCGTYTWGETEDYLVYIRVPGCNATPVAGQAVASSNANCPATQFTLSLTGNTYGAGQTYQWQSSTDTLNWFDIAGATKGGLTRTQNADTYYRCYITCGGNTDTSAWVLVTTTPFYNCYCTPTHPTCNGTDQITNVTIQNTNLNNSPATCPNGATNPYFQFPASGNTTAYMIKGATYQLDVTSNTGSIISVWIDYNQNGAYEASEWTQVTTGSTANTPASISLTIPTTALNGQTGMRIRSRLTGNQNGAGDACLGMGSGQTHDYVVTLSQPFAIDAGINSISEPGQYACYSNAEPVTVVIQNFGTDTLDMSVRNVSINVDLSNGATATLDTVLTSGILVPGDTVSVFFNNSIDLSSLATQYDLKAYVTMANDSNAYNDTVNMNITTVTPAALDYIENFDNAAGIPTSYTANGMSYNAAGGVGSSGSLRANMNFITPSSFGNSPIIGPVTAKSVFKFSYKASTQLSADDSLAVYLTFDCGKTFNQVFNINQNNTNVNGFQSFEYDLSAFAGNTVAAIFFSLNNSGSTYTIDLDNVVVAERPALDLGPDSASCAGVLLNANPTQNSNYSVLWNNGTTNDTLTANTSGVYWAKITDFNTGLTSVDSVNISIYSTPVVNLGGPINGCGGGAGVQLDAGSWGAGYKFLWSNGDTAQKTMVYAAGSYSVTVTTPGGCAGQGNINVTFTPAPVGVSLIKGTPYNGNFNNGSMANPDNACVGSTISYEMTPPSAYGNSGFGTNWTIKSFYLGTLTGTIPSAGTFSATPPVSGNGKLSFTPSAAEGDSMFILMVTVKDSVTGCDTTVSRFIKINVLPTPNIGADKTVCPGTSASFDAGSYASYLWSTGATTQTVNVTASGDVWVKVTDANGCVNSDTAKVSNYTVTPVNLGADKGICPKTAITLDAGNGNSYSWSTGATNKTLDITAANTYFVDVTDANGCVSRDSINITALAGPNPAFTSARLNGLSTNVQFTATDNTAGNTYNWDFGDATNSSAQNPTHVYVTNGTYNVRLIITNSNGCKDTSSTQTVVNSGIVGLGEMVNGVEVFPNPFRGTTTLKYALTLNTQVTIELFDAAGKLVATPVNAKQNSGSYQVEISTLGQVAGGVYTLRITANGETTTLKIVDLK